MNEKNDTPLPIAKTRDSQLAGTLIPSSPVIHQLVCAKARSASAGRDAPRTPSPVPVTPKQIWTEFVAKCPLNRRQLNRTNSRQPYRITESDFIPGPEFCRSQKGEETRFVQVHVGNSATAFTRSRHSQTNLGPVEILAPRRISN